MEEDAEIQFLLNVRKAWECSMKMFPGAGTPIAEIMRIDGEINRLRYEKLQKPLDDSPGV